MPLPWNTAGLDLSSIPLGLLRQKPSDFKKVRKKQKQNAILQAFDKPTILVFWLVKWEISVTDVVIAEHLKDLQK